MKLLKKIINFFYRKVILFADYKIWQNQFKYLNLEKINTQKSFLICSIFAMPATIKFEMIISALLYTVNYSGYILIRAKNNYYGRIVSVNPNCKILYFDDFINKNDIETSKTQSRKIIENFKKKKLLLKNKFYQQPYENLEKVN